VSAAKKPKNDPLVPSNGKAKAKGTAKSNKQQQEKTEKKDKPTTNDKPKSADLLAKHPKRALDVSSDSSDDEVKEVDSPPPKSAKSNKAAAPTGRSKQHMAKNDDDNINSPAFFASLLSNQQKQQEMQAVLLTAVAKIAEQFVTGARGGNNTVVTEPSAIRPQDIRKKLKHILEPLFRNHLDSWGEDKFVAHLTTALNADELFLNRIRQSANDVVTSQLSLIREVLRELRTKAALAVKTALFAALKCTAEAANALSPAERDELCASKDLNIEALVQAAFDISNAEDIPPAALV